MIYVSCGVEADKIRNILESAEGDIKFVFVEKKGIKMSFETDTTDLDAAVRRAKDLIKATEIGKVLYFQVTK